MSITVLGLGTCRIWDLTWYAWSVWIWQRLVGADWLRTVTGADGLRCDTMGTSVLKGMGGVGRTSSRVGKAGGAEEVGETGVRLERPSVSESTLTSSSV